MIFFGTAGCLYGGVLSDAVWWLDAWEISGFYGRSKVFSVLHLILPCVRGPLCEREDNAIAAVNLGLFTMFAQGSRMHRGLPRSMICKFVA